MTTPAPSPTNEYIYILKPARLEMLTEGPTLEEAALIGEHFDYIKRLEGEGTVTFGGRTMITTEDCIGIVVYTAPTPEDAEQIMKNDPAVKAGVMNAKCYPFKVIFGK